MSTTNPSTKAAHSPGPWTIELAVVADGKAYVCHTQPDLRPGRCVADVHAATDEGAANARLIAAAPELLEACKAAMDTIEFYKAGVRTGTWSDIHEKLRAAIARAEGGAS